VDSDCAQALVGARVNIGGRERHPRGPGLVPHGLATDPHESWLSALAWNVAGILLFGLLVAAFTSNSHRAYAYALAGLDPAQRAAAVDASFRGPVPVDAPVRDAAIRVAGRRLQSARFWRVLWLVLLCLLILSAGAGLAQGTWPSAWEADDWFNFAVILFFTVAAWHASLSARDCLQILRQTSDFDVKSMGGAR
jgi:hypothetical protein